MNTRMYPHLNNFKQKSTLRTMSLYGLLFVSLLLLPQALQAQFSNYFAGPNAGKSNTTGSGNSFIGYETGYSNTIGSYNSFLGNVAGYSNTTGEENSFVGSHAGYRNTTGSFNSFVGTGAGNENTSGSRNSFFGYQAGYSNTIGTSNSFVGYFAGLNNTTGNDNSFVGNYAGLYNTTGFANSFVGTEAGHRNTTGLYNSFLGYKTGFSNTTGNFNSFVGTQAGLSNTTGTSNAFFGDQAGLNNTTAERNTFIGSETGKYNTTGSFNSFLGSYAGYLNTTGSNNSFVGSYAGYSNTTGASNSFIGYRAGYLNTAGTFNSFTGNFAGNSNTTGNNNTFTGYAAGYLNTTGSGNAFLGYHAGYSNQTGIDNVAIGRSAGYNNTGSGNVFIGYLASNPVSAAGITNAVAIGKRASVTASNSISLGAISGVNGASVSTNVGIGTTAPAYRLQVNGTAAKPGSSAWTVASDKRLKQNVKQFTDGLEVLEQIKPVHYRYNGKAGMPVEKEYIGIIAQEVQQVAPYMVGKFTYQDTTGKQEEYLDYDATALTYILVNSVKAQQQTITEIKQENEALKQELAEIKELLLKQMPATNNSEARLWQNTPNPYNQSTVIKYQVPTAAQSAFIKVYSATGQELQSFDITGKTSGEVTVLSNTLAAGTYVYKLFIDGKSLDSKKLVLVK